MDHVCTDQNSSATLVCTLVLVPLPIRPVNIETWESIVHFLGELGFRKDYKIHMVI